MLDVADVGCGFVPANAAVQALVVLLFSWAGSVASYG
jgi:hypothetical protein